MSAVALPTNRWDCTQRAMQVLEIASLTLGAVLGMAAVANRDFVGTGLRLLDGVVKLVPPEKISKTLQIGEFTKARIVGTPGHDLVAVPV